MLSMTQRPNTAPEGKMKSKFISNRTNAVKEIEAWVKGGSDYPQRDAVRMSGQLTDNVTEDRMLKAKLWELSRERYKFLSQSAYDRKVFMDRVQRKSSAVRRSLQQTERLSSSKSDRGSKSSNARMVMLDRLDPTKARDRPKEFKDNSVTGQNPRVRNIKSVRFGQRLLPEEGHGHGQGRLLNRPTATILSEQNLATRDEKQRNKFEVDHKSLPDISARNAPRSGGSYRAFQTQPEEPMQISSWAQKRSRLGSISSSATSLSSVRFQCTDPRIMKLESSLSPVHFLPTSPDVATVVREIAALHLPPKINNETKPKTALKILQHMRARGLIK